MVDNRDAQPQRIGSTLEALLDRVEQAGRGSFIRDDIVGSWRRSALAGLTPNRFEVPYDPEIDERGRLAWAADAALGRVADDLDGSNIGLLLTDHRGLIVWRRAGGPAAQQLFDRIQLAPGFLYGEAEVGTNAIGTALESRSPTLVEAEEHFADALGGMACAAVTITDPSTGRVLGAVDLSCAAADASPLMLPLAKRAVWEIQQHLLEASSVGERLLQEQFLRARRTSKTALVAVSAHTLLVNAAAATMFQPEDRERLWDCLRQALLGRRHHCTFALSSNEVITIRCQPVLDGTRTVGALARVEPTRGPDEQPGRRATARAFGWDSLTDAELSVAAQVSRGLTNREAAAHLYLSPHTIDFHLRQVFRKLGVQSRVGLTRVVLERGDLT